MKKYIGYTAIFVAGIGTGFVGLVVNDIAQQIRQERAYKNRKPATVTNIPYTG